MKRLVIILLTMAVSVSALAQTSVKDGMARVADRYGVSFVYDPSLPVNAPGRAGDLKKARLEDALDALFKGTGISWELSGKYVVLKLGTRRDGAPAPREPLEAFAAIGEPGARMDTITAARITDRIDRKLNATQTGLTRLDGSDLNKGFAVFSTPDLVKTLQLLPGVASGTELMSGLFVHGGTGGDNLFLLDGSSVYNTSHLLGIFSAFNSDVVDGVDFYKSGFPARYGGRLSSVVDVTTRDGDLYDYHGSVSLGLIDGRLQLEGPLVKGRTSFQLGLRRTWLDAVTVPALIIINSKKRPGERTLGHYAFWDMNAGVTHHLENGDVIRLRLFSGMDRLKAGADNEVRMMDGPAMRAGNDRYRGSLNWGSTTAGIIWNHNFTGNLASKAGLYYSHNVSSIKYGARGWSWNDGDIYACSEESDRSGIHGIRLGADFDWEPSAVHHIRFGASWEHHAYLPERSLRQWYETPKETKGLSDYDSGTRYSGEEPSVYFEDEMSPLPGLTVNAGVRAALFLVKGKTYILPEPRVAVRYDLSDAVALKASYTWMNQFEHRLQTTYVDLPTYLWLPTTSGVHPMHSQQAAAGVYATLPHGMHLTVEGFWKTMEHIYEYAGPSSLYPPVDRWETAFTEGQGRAYGAEVAFGWEDVKTNIDVAYTLSWSERFFREFSDRWYPDRNDNRHKFNITATHKFSEGFEIYGGWVYHSGNRMSVGTQGKYYATVELDDGSISHLFKEVFTDPNNIKLPDYHRLDAGMNFIKHRPDGKVRTWNLSLYNAYCRFNTVYAEVVNDKGDYKGRSYGFIPIIPTFSYTLKF